MDVKTSNETPAPVLRMLRKLGSDLYDARRRRRVTAAVLAERVSISRTTLHKIERGDEGVAIGSYATVLFSLGLLEGFGDLADVRQDRIGLALDEEHLPKRVSRKGNR